MINIPLYVNNTLQGVMELTDKRKLVSIILSQTHTLTSAQVADVQINFLNHPIYDIGDRIDETIERLDYTTSV